MSTVVLSEQKKHDQSRNIMVFILVMSMSGLENLIAELMPELNIGLFEIGISTFYFVPLSLVILFGSWWAALAVPIGELIFADLILGEFGGLGELEEVLLLSLTLYLAARVVRDPRNRTQILIAGLVGYFIAELAATGVDIFTVWVGVEEFEAVPGLPESIVALEFIEFGFEYLISGVLLGAIPAMFLTPRLYGKIEPLMGIEPRRPNEPLPGPSAGRMALIAIGLIGAAFAVATLAAAGFTLVEWEPEFLDTIGEWFIWVPFAIAAIATVLVLVTRPHTRKGDHT